MKTDETIKLIYAAFAEREAEIADARHQQQSDADFITQLASKLAGAEAEVIRLRDDAERYRWIRQSEHGQPRTRLMQYHQDIHLDKAIDAARKDTK
jgi:multidrug resistance efflux pump